MNSDILISIFPKYLKVIRAGTKNFEFRPFKINAEYINMWVYETSPIKELNTLIVVRKPVRRLEDTISKRYGLGDSKFMSHITNGRVAYEIVLVKKLNQNISLPELRELGLYNAPQNYLKVENYPRLEQKLEVIKKNLE